MIRNVVKVGGALGKGKGLEMLMKKISETACGKGVLLVPGGGVFADGIRDCDRRFGLGGETSHWMAVLAMDQYAHLLASLGSNLSLVQGLAQARSVIASGRVPVLLSYNLLYQADALPRSWDVTSDSIAAWVAGICGAEKLVLLKTVDGLFSRDPSVHADTELLEEIGSDELSRCGGVDPCFGKHLGMSGTDAWVISGLHPERLIRLLDTGETIGTRIVPGRKENPSTGRRRLDT